MVFIIASVDIFDKQTLRAPEQTRFANLYYKMMTNWYPVLVTNAHHATWHQTEQSKLKSYTKITTMSAMCVCYV